MSEINSKVRLDWRLIILILGLIGNIVLTAYKSGQIVARVETLKVNRVEFEQRIERRLERIENMFLARPGGPR